VRWSSAEFSSCASTRSPCRTCRPVVASVTSLTSRKTSPVSTARQVRNPSPLVSVAGIAYNRIYTVQNKKQRRCSPAKKGVAEKYIMLNYRRDHIFCNKRPFEEFFCAQIGLLVSSPRFVSCRLHLVFDYDWCIYS